MVLTSWTRLLFLALVVAGFSVGLDSSWTDSWSRPPQQQLWDRWPASTSAAGGPDARTVSADTSPGTTLKFTLLPAATAFGSQSTCACYPWRTAAAVPGPAA